MCQGLEHDPVAPMSLSQKTAFLHAIGETDGFIENQILFRLGEGLVYVLAASCSPVCRILVVSRGQLVEDGCRAVRFSGTLVLAHDLVEEVIDVGLVGTGVRDDHDGADRFFLSVGVGLLYRQIQGLLIHELGLKHLAGDVVVDSVDLADQESFDVFRFFSS